MATMPDILIMGGGAIGLAIALELRLRGANVTVVTRDAVEAASQSAAGMLAPQAEKLPPGPLLELCLQSRSLYPAWTQKLEAMTGLPTGYWSCGILAPVYETESAAKDAIASTTPDSPHPTPDSPLPTPAHWLDRPTIHQHQPGLSQSVIGGWWYPQDAQVDNRALTNALWAAVHDAGVEIRAGVTVQKVLHQQSQVIGVQAGEETLQAGHYVLAAGAWSQELLPIPVHPRKGQMLSVRVPTGAIALPLQTVLFGSEIYIVPRQDGRIVIGATSEDVGFVPHNTPAGIQSLLSRAIRLYPALEQFPIQELWWGFRPTTPDELPILGTSPYANLTLATGHHRNGILLIPVTAQLIADRILHQKNDPLLNAFHWSRFKGLP